MMLKERAAPRSKHLLEDPQPEASWRDGFDEKSGSSTRSSASSPLDYDRSGRLGAAPSRDRLIEEPRRTYHEVFEAPTRSRYVASA